MCTVLALKDIKGNKKSHVIVVDGVVSRAIGKDELIPSEGQARHWELQDF